MVNEILVVVAVIISGLVTDYMFQNYKHSDFVNKLCVQSDFLYLLFDLSPAFRSQNIKDCILETSFKANHSTVVTEIYIMKIHSKISSIEHL